MARIDLSRGASNFVVKFHEEFATGISLAQAVRRARQHALRKGGPHGWPTHHLLSSEKGSDELVLAREKPVRFTVRVDCKDLVVGWHTRRSRGRCTRRRACASN